MPPHKWQLQDYLSLEPTSIPDNKVHGSNMGPIWGRQDPGGPHVGPMNFAIWDATSHLSKKADTDTQVHVI